MSDGNELQFSKFKLLIAKYVHHSRFNRYLWQICNFLLFFALFFDQSIHRFIAGIDSLGTELASIIKSMRRKSVIPSLHLYFLSPDFQQSQHIRRMLAEANQTHRMNERPDQKEIPSTQCCLLYVSVRIQHTHT